MNFLRTLRLSDQHLARRNKTGDQIQLCVIEVECFAIEIAIHFRVGEKDLRRAAFRDNLKHS